MNAKFVHYIYMCMNHAQNQKMNKSVHPNRDREHETLRLAIQSLAKITGVQVKVLGQNMLESARQIDARVLIASRAGQNEFKVEVKGEVRAAILPQILEKFRKDRDHWLFIAQYIPGPTKEQFRQNGINYLEASGNCFINAGQVYLFINDKAVKQVRKTAEGKLWKPSGLKLLFVMLQDPTLIGATYRELSEAAGIALGSIHPLLEEIRQEGWLDHDRRPDEQSHSQRERLATRWAEIYPVVLQPRLRIGMFRFLSPGSHWPRELPDGTYWGGEPAGELYTHRLVPETFTLYTDRPATELVKKLRIVPDEKGNIAVYQKFWRDRPGLAKIPGAVPPLLAYADLRNSSDSRAWETAEKLKSLLN